MSTYTSPNKKQVHVDTKLSKVHPITEKVKKTVNKLFAPFKEIKSSER